MRLRIILFSLVVMAALVFSACAPAGPAPTGGEAVEAPAGTEALPVPREEAAILNETTIFRVFSSWNPFVPNAAGQGYVQGALEHLFYINWATGDFINWLAEGFEYNEDFTQVTFKLRPEVLWNT